MEFGIWNSEYGNATHDTVRMHPINSFELLFFAVFGQTTTEQTQVDKIKNLATPTQPYWVEYLFKIVFGIYMLVSVVVLINLLIAMMSDTYQRIQVVLLMALHKMNHVYSLILFYAPQNTISILYTYIL